MNCGHSHRSKLEAALCKKLMDDQAAGRLEMLQVEDHVYLSDADICYVADFKVRFNTGEVAWYEAKGFESQRWPIIKQLWKHYGPGRLFIYSGWSNSVKLIDIIESKKGANNG